MSKEPTEHDQLIPKESSPDANQQQTPNEPAKDMIDSPPNNNLQRPTNDQRNVTIDPNFIPDGSSIVRSNGEPKNSEQQNEPKSLSGAARKGFILKVYTILLTQLTLTSVLVTLAVYIPEYRHWQRQHDWVGWVLFSLSIILLYAMFCYPILCQKVPTNYI